MSERTIILKASSLFFSFIKSNNSIIFFILQKTLAGRVTKEQKELLLEFMKNNVYVGRGQYNCKSSSQQHDQCWKDVTAQLNSMSGSKKTPQQWKRVS